jgi:D-glucuronyl C5-epimerase C-terminus
MLAKVRSCLRLWFDAAPAQIGRGRAASGARSHPVDDGDSRRRYQRLAGPAAAALAIGLVVASAGPAAARGPAGVTMTSGDQGVAGLVSISGGTLATKPTSPQPRIGMLPAYFRNWQPNDAALKDADGVVLKDYGGSIGKQYQPTLIAQSALGYYDRWLEEAASGQKASDRTAFLVQINWLVSHQTPDGRWLFTFAWGTQQVPWWSAMTEGVAMSALLRAYAMTGNPAALTAITRARTTFERDLNHDGVSAPVLLGRTTYLVYQEYRPGYASNVLNGWIFSLVGLYEAATDLRDSTASADLWGSNRGIPALKALLPYYDTGDWSRYDMQQPGKHVLGELAPLSYHTLVVGQLRYLAAISGDPFFTTYSDRFMTDLDVCEALEHCPPTR